MRLSHNSREQATHIGDRHEIPGSGEQGTLCYRAPQDLFFIRPLLSRSVDKADFRNTKKQTQRVKQNEDTEEYVPNERRGHNKEFTVVVIKILTRLEKRMENLTEAFNKETGNINKKQR